MLKGSLLHPQILKVLGESGHGSNILIADGNYPFRTGSNPAAERVFLNVMPGLCSVVQVVEALVPAIPIEAAHVMVPDAGDEPSIFADFRRLLPDLTLTTHARFPFYDLAREPNVSLVIATGEQRVYANILLTIGVVPPPQ
jgi:L-fucose mutarotase